MSTVPGTIHCKKQDTVFSICFFLNQAKKAISKKISSPTKEEHNLILLIPLSFQIIGLKISKLIQQLSAGNSHRKNKNNNRIAKQQKNFSSQKRKKVNVPD